jgi:hypothetical protein
MSRKWFVAAIVIGAMFVVGVRNVNAQSANNDEGRFELGGQFSALHLSAAKVVSAAQFPCFVAPCPIGVTTRRSRELELALGGRVGYRAWGYFTLEAEANFFPRDNNFEDGRKVEALFGAKVGKRSKTTGWFGKARPGFLYASKGDLQSKPNTLCVAIFPPPLGCFDPKEITGFAFDIGGVAEVYPSPRTIIRFDAGDTIVRLGDRRVPVLINPPPGATFPSREVVIFKPAETTHNFQVSVGFGFRF